MRIYKTLIILCFVFTFQLVNAQSDLTSQIKNLVGDIIDIHNENISTQNPLKSINEIAEKEADTVIYITKENISSAFKKAKEYKYAILTVENHTIVRITAPKNTVLSGSWAAKMPYGKGYVKKNIKLTFYENHLNFIIGIPDKQTRRLFLFR